MNEREQSRAHVLADRIEDECDRQAITGTISVSTNIGHEIADLLRALADRPEPAQPVAWMHRDDHRHVRTVKPEGVAAEWWVPLYASPPMQPAVRLRELLQHAKLEIECLGRDLYEIDRGLRNRPTALADPDLLAEITEELAAPPSHPAPSEAAPEQQEKS